MSGSQYIRVIDGRTNSLTFRCTGTANQSFIFATDGAGVSASLVLHDGQPTPETVTLRPSAITTDSYLLTFPPTQATGANQVLANNGTGLLNWLDLGDFAGGASNLTTPNRIVTVDAIAGNITQSANWSNIIDGSNDIFKSEGLNGCIQIGPDDTEGTWRICVDTADNNALIFYKYDTTAANYVIISNFNE